MDKRCEHFLFRKLSGLPTPATILTCVIQTQPALQSGSRSACSDAMSVDRLLRPRSLRPPVRKKFLWDRSGCLCKHATANLRAKLKSPKLVSSWEGSSPSRSSANNQKCSAPESSSRSLLPCPLSYSNPCITSVYASHLLMRGKGRAQQHTFQHNTWDAVSTGGFLWIKVFQILLYSWNRHRGKLFKGPPALWVVVSFTTGVPAAPCRSRRSGRL